MGVDIDHARRKDEALGVDGLARLPQITVNGDNAAVLHGDVDAV